MKSTMETVLRSLLRIGVLNSCCLLLLGILLLFMSGCSSTFPTLERIKPLPSVPVCRVAVLPFLDESDYPLANTIAYKVFIAELNSLGNYMVTQEGDVQKLYHQLRIPFGEPPSQEQFQILANRLNVQLMFIGKVIEMQENRGVNGSGNPVLAMRVDILDGHTGDLLWSVYHHRQGIDYQKTMHYGIINTISGLCQQVSIEIINLTFKQGLTQCDVSPQF